MIQLSLRRTALSAVGMFAATSAVVGVGAFVSGPGSSSPQASSADLSATAQTPRTIDNVAGRVTVDAEQRLGRDLVAQQTARQAAEKAAREKAAREKAAREKAARSAREKAAESARKAAAARASRSTRAGGGSAKAIARAMVADRGWSSSQFSCLERLWQKESNWRSTANNPSSGAYGIPQSLPGEKMASAGSDWRTNPATQIKWGIGYIADVYGTPCSAWAHSQATNWY